MTTATERDSMLEIQAAIKTIKDIAQKEIRGNASAGNAVHANAWTEVHGRTTMFHAKLTKIGMKHFPEFFDEVVIKGGGGGR